MSGGDLKRTWRVGEQAFPVDVTLEHDHLVGVVGEGDQARRVEARVHRTAPDAVIVRTEGRLHRAVLVRRGPVLWVAMDGHTYELTLEVGNASGGRTSRSALATSPMTGVLIEVRAKKGEAVREGDVLFVVEAMKMEYTVRAPRAAVVRDVHARPGDPVKVDAPVVTFEEES